jgi:hypothetical protein
MQFLRWDEILSKVFFQILPQKRQNEADLRIGE